MKFGFSVADITPQHPMELAAFRSQRGKGKLFEDIQDPLMCYVCVYRHGEYRSCLVSCDLLWLSATVKQMLLEVLREDGWNSEHIMLTATHTHSGPQILADAHSYGAVDSGYEPWLVQQISGAIRRASDHSFQGHVFVSRNDTQAAVINRVCFSGKRCFNSPNEHRPVDRTVRYAWICDADKAPRAIWINFACHPVFYKGNRVSADYPGVLRREIQRKFGKDINVFFLQGFGGDIRPDYRDQSMAGYIYTFLKFGSVKARFQKSMDKHIDAFVHQLVDSIDGPTNFREEISCREPQANVRMVYKESGNPDARVEIHRMDIGGLTLAGVNAEVFAEYARHWDEDTGNDPWPVSCANGMYGYIPDEGVLSARSGYEYNSWRNFGRQAPLPRDISRTLINYLMTLNAGDD